MKSRFSWRSKPIEERIRYCFAFPVVSSGPGVEQLYAGRRALRSTTTGLKDWLTQISGAICHAPTVQPHLSVVPRFYPPIRGVSRVFGCAIAPSSPSLRRRSVLRRRYKKIKGVLCEGAPVGGFVAKPIDSDRFISLWLYSVKHSSSKSLRAQRQRFFCILLNVSYYSKFISFI